MNAEIALRLTFLYGWLPAQLGFPALAQLKQPSNQSPVLETPEEPAGQLSL